jgi:predicted permease
MTDVIGALRSLRRSPGFALTALVALALGIGAATTVFSVADHILLRPLPYADADRLVTVGADVRSKGQSNWAVKAEEYDAWRQGSRTLADLGGHQTFGRFTLGLGEAPVEIVVNRITGNFLGVLGVSPAVGRPFAEADFVPGSPLVLLLTDRAWRRHFAADRSAVGRFVTVNGAPAEIAGVLPRGFAYPATNARSVPDVLIPLQRTKESSGSGVLMIGRLAPGASVEAARAEMDAMAARRAGDAGLRNARIDGATVEALSTALEGRSLSVLKLLLGAVAALLLIGCVNVANLFLARGADRRGEFAVRAALGASRGALVKLALAESIVLAVAGGVAGALLAYLAVGVVGPLIPADLQRLGEAAVDGRALAFSALATGVVVALACIGPALTAARANVSRALTEESARTTGVRWRVRQVLVAIEVALAVVLLVGGGLMINSIVRVLHVDSGYTPESTLTMRVQLPRGKTYPSRSKEFVARVLAAAQGVPGVSTAAAIEGVPLGNTLNAGHYRVEPFPWDWMKEGVPTTGVCCTQTQWVTSSFLQAAGIAVIQGRGFTPTDEAGAPAVALISEGLARKFPGGMQPVGQYLTSAEDGGKDNSDRRLIVGVVRDVRDLTLERPALPAIYLPMEERGASALTLVARTSVDPISIAGAVQKAIQNQAGPAVITDVLTFEDLMLKSVAPRHLNAWLFGSFGVVGLLLAVVGIGSVVSYSVSRRTREMGLRLALGARPQDVGLLVVRESMVPVLAGLIVGLGAAMALSRFVDAFLFEVAPRDVWTYVIVCVVLAVAAALAAVLPARRAARVDPLVALRAE